MEQMGFVKFFIRECGFVIEEFSPRVFALAVFVPEGLCCPYTIYDITWDTK